MSRVRNEAADKVEKAENERNKVIDEVRLRVSGMTNALLMERRINAELQKKQEHNQEKIQSLTERLSTTLNKMSALTDMIDSGNATDAGVYGLGRPESRTDYIARMGSVAKNARAKWSGLTEEIRGGLDGHHNNIRMASDTMVDRIGQAAGGKRTASPMFYQSKV